VHESTRQYIHDYMADNAARHAAFAYPGFTGSNTATQLFALLADVALACLMEIEAELADPGPGQSLACAAGLSAKTTLLTALGESLDLKNRNPAAAAVNRLTAWRVTTAGSQDVQP
jgi:hypothetical protein